MYFLLFLFYFLLCSWFIGRWSFFRNSGIPAVHLKCYYALKVAAGVGYGYYFQRWQNGGDTWSYHQDGLMETGLLRHDPLRFITTLFPGPNHRGFSGFFATRHSWWNDLDANTLPKLLGVCNLLTGSNYYGNVVLVNLLLLAGPVLLLRTWRQISGAGPNKLHYLPFLVPSFVFWCSGLHKEGFLVLALGMALSAVAALLRRESGTGRQLLQLLAALLMVTALRNFLLPPLLLSLASWVWVARTKWQPVPAFAGLLLFLGITGLLLAWIFPQYDPAGVLAARRAAFDNILADSKISLPPLAPDLWSMARQLPAAFAVGLLRPFPQDVFNWSSALACADQVLLWGTTLLLLLRPRSITRRGKVLSCTLLMLALLVILIIGYTVPVLGAVVRYRSIITPFWLLGCLAFGKNKAATTTH